MRKELPEEIAYIIIKSTDQQKESENTTQRRKHRQKEETKNRRMQALVKPSLYNALKAIAERDGISVNEALNEAIEDYIKLYR